MQVTEDLKNVDASIREKVSEWLSDEYDVETRNRVRELIKTAPDELMNAFYTSMSFGTGGLRGIMDVGTNRMNIYTIRLATQGLANYLKKTVTAQPIKVVIGFDSRNNSKLFAQEAAKVLAGNNMEALIFNELRPTPLVSYACRTKQCHAAIMVTASHNPPQYNGYKVYWQDGAQVLPPHDKGIIEEVGKIKSIREVKLADLDDKRITTLYTELDEQYLKDIFRYQLYPKAKIKELRILYSSLHGTGVTLVPEALRRWGFTCVDLVEEQCVPDGNFPTATTPNPEERKALTLGIEKLLKEKYDIFIATDPDCDRLGVVANVNGEAVCLTGNHIAAIDADAIVKTMSKEQLAKSGFIKTIVTTELFRAIVEKSGAHCVDVLPGFKYIAEKIRTWEVDPKALQYVFGAEESYGFLLGTLVRDKDAVLSSCLIAEVAARMKMVNSTLQGALDALYSEYGYYFEKQFSMKFADGKKGKDDQKALMASLRANPPKKINGKTVVEVGDMQQGISRLQSGEEKKIDLPSSDVLVYSLEDGSKVVIRPSGTEPKTKIYLLLYAPPEKEMKAVIQRVQQESELLEAELREMLER